MKGSIDHEKEYRSFQNTMKSDIMLYFKNIYMKSSAGGSKVDGGNELQSYCSNRGDRGQQNERGWC